jgi:hypothetical protein
MLSMSFIRLFVSRQVTDSLSTDYFPILLSMLERIDCKGICVSIHSFEIYSLTPCIYVASYMGIHPLLFIFILIASCPQTNSHEKIFSLFRYTFRQVIKY